MSNLIAWDRSLSVLLNQTLQASWLDPVMVVLSDRTVWISVMVAATLLALALRKKVWVKRIVIMLIAIGLADALCYRVLKPSFARLRPCHTEGSIRVVRSCGGYFGFPSNHAAQGAAAATVIALSTGVIAVPVVLAGAVGLSRVYLGVHYVGDILFGFLVGFIVGFVTYRILRLWENTIWPHLSLKVHPENRTEH